VSDLRFFEELGAELERAARETIAPTRPRRRRTGRRRLETTRRPVGTGMSMVPVIVAVAVTFGVCGLAIALLAHRDGPPLPQIPIAVSAIAPPAPFRLPVGGPAGAVSGAPRTFFGPAIARTARLAAQAVDPRGGLPWGLRTFRTTRGRTCLQVGRLQLGVIGALGQDNAFGDDGRFHPIALNDDAGDCAQTDGHGHAFVNIADGEISASANPSGGCRTGRNPTRIPPCRAGDLRSIEYGVLGPDAVSVTYRLGGRLYIKPTGPDGAYLIVGPATNGTCSGPVVGGHRVTGCATGEAIGTTVSSDAIVSITYRGGQVCDVARATARSAQGCAVVGYVAPHVPRATAAQVTAPVTVRELSKTPYCLARGATITYQTACNGPVPPGSTIDRAHPKGTYAEIEIAWTARVAVTNTNSLYEYNISYPCNSGGEDRSTRSHIRAGQRIAERDQLTISHCHGDYTVSVGFVPDVGPGGGLPLQGGVPGKGGSLLVGQRSFTLR
jgi:hypothetical protein